MLNANKKSGVKTTRRRIPTQKRSRDKVELILQVSQRILEKEGLSKLNTNRIAEEAGLGVGTIYEYFPNKESIAFELIERLAVKESDEILARFETMGEQPFSEAVAVLVETTVRLYRKNRGLYRMLRRISSENRQFVGMRESERRVMVRIREAIEIYRDHMTVDDPDLAVFILFHTVEGLCYQAVNQDSPHTDEELAAEITKVVLRYLGLAE